MTGSRQTNDPSIRLTLKVSELLTIQRMFEGALDSCQSDEDERHYGAIVDKTTRALWRPAR